MSSRLERLIRMEQQIRNGSYPNVETFCRMFGVKQRTIYEDIRALRQRLGLDIRFDRGRTGYFTPDPNSRLPAFELTQEELFAVGLACELMLKYNDAAFTPVVRSALEKILDRQTACPPGQVETLRRTWQQLAQHAQEIKQLHGLPVPD